MKTKTKTLLAAFVAIPIVLASCSKKPETADGSKPEKTSGEFALTTCVVSGEELGSMGKPVEYVHEGTTVKFCCKSCIPDFKEDPERYLAKLK